MNIDLSLLPKTVRFRDGAVLSREDAIRKMEDMANEQLRFMDALGPATGGKLLESKSQDFKASFQNIADELKKPIPARILPPKYGRWKITQC